MSDIEQEWKPKARPQSTMAQAFSSALDSAFSLDSEVDHLALAIDQKKHKMMIQSLELEQLQRRIREAEQRLKARQSVSLDGQSVVHAGSEQNEEPERDFRSTGEKNETATATVASSTSISDNQPSAEPPTDSSTSRDSSHGRDGPASSEQADWSSDAQRQEYDPQGDRRPS